MNQATLIYSFVVLAAGGLAYIPSAKALTCGIGYVNGVPQDVCWIDEGSGGGGGGGGGGGQGEVGGGDGGGADGGGVWVTVPGYPDVRLNLIKKEVREYTLGCSDEPILRQRAMQVVVIKRPLAAIKDAKDTYTLKLMATGESQKFWRTNATSSLQMSEISECGK
ncbi:TPA: hypothetical protein ACKQDF_000813 [Stenotrophomonas maltophilia]